jgi:hypothetical protein
MSDASVIQDTSLTLKSILESRLSGSGGASATVTVDSPHRGNHEELRVNLFLYNIVQDEGRRNSGGWIPLERAGSKQTFAPEPLALRLYYLVTAFANDGLTEHHLLGEAMQALHKYRRVPESLLKGTLKSSPIRAPHLELTLLNLDIDALQKIWGSQSEPIRTSVAYEVEALFLDADEPNAEVTLVETREVNLIPFPNPTVITPDAAPPGATVRLYGADLLAAHPSTGKSLVRIWFGGVEAQPLPGTHSAGAVSLKVPAGLPRGPVNVHLQLDRYMSHSVPFDVLEPV